MQELKKITIEDRSWVQPLLELSNSRGSEFTFANMFNWSSVYTIKIAPLQNWLLIRSGQQVGSFSYPAGQGDLCLAVEEMQAQCAAEGRALVIYNVGSDQRAALEAALPGQFEFTPVRDNYEYIYLQESLSTLAGKKLHGKRNHIARFKENNPDWCYEPITLENLAEVRAMNAEWCRLNGCAESHSLQKEACAVRSAFDHYQQQELIGGLLRADGKVIGFTFGSAVTKDTFVVHVEKAFYEIQGAYPMINQQFVQNALSSYTYVNREDDLGEPGLRRAKESYQPAFLYERYVAKEVSR